MFLNIVKLNKSNSYDNLKSHVLQFYNVYFLYYGSAQFRLANIV